MGHDRKIPWTSKKLNPIGPYVYIELYEKLRFLKKVDNDFFFLLFKQYKQLQFEKPSDIELDMPIHKRSAINLFLRSWQKGPPFGLKGLKPLMN